MLAQHAILAARTGAALLFDFGGGLFCHRKGKTG